MCPVEIINSFIQFSKHNTDREIETCAILAGVDNGSALIVTTMILPK
jgi:hypothetical protein